MSARATGFPGNRPDGWTPWPVLSGRCEYACAYCHTRDAERRFPNSGMKYGGPPRVCRRLMREHRERRSYSVAPTGDLFAGDVPDEVILEILSWCRGHGVDRYLFMTQNPARMALYLGMMPGNRVLGTTIQTNRDTSGFSRAPGPKARAEAMASLREQNEGPLLVAIRPVLAFDIEPLMAIMRDIAPDEISIGALVRGADLHLDEPEPWKVELLVDRCRDICANVVLEQSLRRMLPGRVPPRRSRAERERRATQRPPEVTLDRFVDMGVE